MSGANPGDRARDSAAWPARLAGLALTLGAVLTQGLAAQNTTNAARATTDGVESLAHQLSTPTTTSPASTASSIAGLSFSSTAKTAEAKLAFLSGLTNFALTASGPIDSDTKEADLFDQTGLALATQIGLSFSSVYFPVGKDVDPLAISAVCLKYVKSRDCDRKSLSPAGQEEFDVVTHFATPTVFGVTASLGGRDFSYVDKNGLNPHTVPETEWTVAAGIGHYLGAPGLMALNYRYSRSFHAGTSTLLCTPLGTQGALSCDNRTIGGPRLEERSEISVELRTFFSDVTFDPTGGYDVLRRKIRVDVPIYFFKDKNNGFVGGVAASWESGAQRPGYRVFVGKALGGAL